MTAGSRVRGTDRTIVQVVAEARGTPGMLADALLQRAAGDVGVEAHREGQGARGARRERGDRPDHPPAAEARAGRDTGQGHARGELVGDGEPARTVPPVLVTRIV